MSSPRSRTLLLALHLQQGGSRTFTRQGHSLPLKRWYLDKSSHSQTTMFTIIVIFRECNLSANQVSRISSLLNLAWRRWTTADRANLENNFAPCPLSKVILGTPAYHTELGIQNFWNYGVYKFPVTTYDSVLPFWQTKYLQHVCELYKKPVRQQPHDKSHPYRPTFSGDFKDCCLKGSI